MVSNSAVRQSLTHMLQSQPSEQIGVPRHLVNPADALYYLDDREPADTEFTSQLMSCKRTFAVAGDFELVMFSLYTHMLCESRVDKKTSTWDIVPGQLQLFTTLATQIKYPVDFTMAFCPIAAGVTAKTDQIYLEDPTFLKFRLFRWVCKTYFHLHPRVRILYPQTFFRSLSQSCHTKQSRSVANFGEFHQLQSSLCS